MSPVKRAVRLLEEYAVCQDPCPVKLNQNESPLDLPPELKQAALARLSRVPWNRYPAAAAAGLTERLSDYAGFPADGILVGNGSNELIQALITAVCDSGDALVTVSPGFSVYKRVGAAMNVRALEVPLREDFSFDVEAIIERGRAARLVILASPNNPTGTVLGLDDIDRLAGSVAGLVAVDEAYYEFHGQTAVPLIAGRENLVVLRTLSKALGLAGLRLGYLLGGPGIVRDLNKAKLPFSVGILQQAAALEILERKPLVEGLVREIVRERDRLFEEMRRLPGIVPFPSRANFILFESRAVPAADVFRRLIDGGVLIRPFSGPLLENKLRVTVGTAGENSAFLSCLGRICREAGG